MKAVSILDIEFASVVEIPDPPITSQNFLLKIEYVGLCGTDLNSFRGLNPMVTLRRVIGHEVASTVIEGSASVPAGSNVTINPYTSCGRCPSCQRGRTNACQFNETYGVQRDGALTEYLRIPDDKVFVADLSPPTERR